MKKTLRNLKWKQIVCGVNGGFVDADLATQLELERFLKQRGLQRSEVVFMADQKIFERRWDQALCLDGATLYFQSSSGAAWWVFRETDVTRLELRDLDLDCSLVAKRQRRGTWLLVVSFSDREGNAYLRSFLRVAEEKWQEKESRQPEIRQLLLAK